MPTKAVAAGGATGIAGAITTIVVAKWWPAADAATVAALTTIISTLIAGIGAYFPKMEGKRG